MPEILVLYGSQTGNSEEAAKRIAQEIPNHFHSKFTARPMQLDDFLEFHKAAWTPLVIIVTSSYGVGAAPMGCGMFRQLCDFMLQEETKSQNRETEFFLKGIRYFMLGLGDSKYTTYFQNPATIDRAMTVAGAMRVGELGKADASGPQLELIQGWMEEVLWPNLKEVVTNWKEEEYVDFCEKAKERTWDLCLKALPQLSEEMEDGSKGNGNVMWKWFAVAVLVVAILLMKTN
eukprot:CAMPEP_0116065380 /NCGR_PEP_ID=MMETSP0322-20121206/9724_1 /TAXON_ID=163516 /ORGANISM="Leptocylindrus danicus var. apora, Strain B651" /LENGTH=231 /DNA_ID=CAMNT_0003551675 /DNA_START=108 /DNA_END=803 /DNA_ORIENTATION=+